MVRDRDTVLCGEPLHGGHRIGTFEPPSLTLRPSAAMMAFRLARDGIVTVFEHFELDVAEHFLPLEEALEVALFAEEENPEDS